MEWLKTQIVLAPKLAHAVGRGLFVLGGLLVIAGLIGRAGMLAINQVRDLGRLPAFQNIAEAYPSLPLWWVPEGWFGYGTAAVLALVGVYVVIAANAVLKVVGGGRRRRHG